MPGPICRRPRWNHRRHDCRFLAWCSDVRLPLRYAGQTPIDHDRLLSLDHWFDNHLRCRKYPYVDRRTYHQRIVRGNPVRTGSRVHQRVRATCQAWSSGWSSAVGDHMGHFNSLLVSFPESEDPDTANMLQRFVRCFIRWRFEPKCRQLQCSCLPHSVSPVKFVPVVNHN
jgi:hypothetical protein